MHKVLAFSALFLISVSAQLIPIWDCPTPLPPAPPATNVKQLRPQDIKAVMAVGDSMSAGFAMWSPHADDIHEFGKMLLEYRGDVFSIGGNPGTYTIPNFLEMYNPDVQGASIGNSIPLDYVKWKNHIIQPFDPKVTHLNGAQSGARIEAVPDQIDYLTEQLKTTYADKIDFDNDWKMLTILIGANNLCDACKNRTWATPEWYGEQLEIVLNKTYTQIPKVFVNVLLMFNISQVHDAMMTSLYCTIAVDFFTTTECGCLTDHSTPEDRLAMDVYAQYYNEKIYEVEAAWDAKNLTTFGVSVQPFLQELSVAAAGTRFLSELDCFHPSGYANMALAAGLWNNMLQPKGKKVNNIPFNITFECPDENSFFQ